MPTGFAFSWFGSPDTFPLGQCGPCVVCTASAMACSLLRCVWALSCSHSLGCGPATRCEARVRTSALSWFSVDVAMHCFDSSRQSGLSCIKAAQTRPSKLLLFSCRCAVHPKICGPHRGSGSLLLTPGWTPKPLCLYQRREPLTSLPSEPQSL